MPLILAGAGSVLAGCGGPGKYYVPEEDIRSPRTLQRRCAGGDAEACLGMAYHYKKGKKVPRDLPAMVAMQHRACELRNQQGCNDLGYSYEYGISGAPQDLDKAIRVFKRACVGEWGEACFHLASLYHRGAIVPGNPQLAAHYLGHACRAGVKQVCDKNPEEALDGSVDVDLVRDVVKGKGKLENCLAYMPPEAEGWLAFRMWLDTEGNAEDVVALDLPHPAVEKCIVDRLEGLEYPPAVGGRTQVTYIITMHGGGVVVHEEPITRSMTVMDRLLERKIPLMTTEHPRGFRALLNEFYFCIDSSGRVFNARLIRRSMLDSEIDLAWLNALKSWRFIPVKIDGKPVQQCSVAAFRFWLH